MPVTTLRPRLRRVLARVPLRVPVRVPDREHGPVDSGAALIMTLLVMVVVGGLATTITTLTVNNLQSASLSRNVGVAVDAADAGVAEAVAYLKTNAVKRMCAVTPTTDPLAAGFSAFDVRTQACVTNAFNATNAVRLPGQPYAVRIATTRTYGPSTAGEYLIASRGYGPGNAQRLVIARLRIQGIGAAPLAFQGNTVRFTGQTAMAGQSIFARGCVYKRDLLTVSGTDAFGLPAAVHSEGAITEDQGTDFSCPSPTKAIHPPNCPSTGSSVNYRYDQDSRGTAQAAGSACLPADAALAAKYYPNGTKLNPGDLEALYGVKQPPLTAEDIDNLKAVAVTQGNYRTTGGTVTPNGANAVMFYENTDVNLGDIQGFRDTATCANHSLLIVVKGGNVSWTSNSSTPLIASVMVVTEDKQFLANGGGIIGSVYADKIVLGGAAAVSGAARDCAALNPSPKLLDYNVVAYREIDG